MSTPTKFGALLKHLGYTEKEKKMIIKPVTKEDLIILLKEAYYGGWMDGIKDVHGNADKFINSILE